MVKVKILNIILFGFSLFDVMLKQENVKTLSVTETWIYIDYIWFIFKKTTTLEYWGHCLLISEHHCMPLIKGKSFMLTKAGFIFYQKCS